MIPVNESDITSVYYLEDSATLVVSSIDSSGNHITYTYRDIPLVRYRQVNSLFNLSKKAIDSKRDALYGKIWQVVKPYRTEKQVYPKSKSIIDKINQR